MTGFNDELLRVLKYAADQQERETFEKLIDENPLDASNHLVYSDWLDEHGEHDEAAFRRAMGEWVRDTPNLVKEFEPLPPHRGVQFSHSLAYPFLPKWVFDGPAPVAGTGRARNAEGLMTVDSPNGPFDAHPHVALHYDDPYDSYRWKTYRGMEEAFRKAHRRSQILQTGRKKE